MSYPPPGFGYPQPAPVANPKATAALVFGILAFTLCGPFTGIPAFILGGKATREIESSGGRQSGRGLATAGRILGILSIASTILIVIWVILVLVFADSTSTSEELSWRRWPADELLTPASLNGT